MKKETVFARKDKNEYSDNIKKLRYWAKENLLNKVVYHPQFPDGIHFTNNGIKEFLNQPHMYFNEKNALIKSIDIIIPKAKVVGEAEDKNGNPNHHFYYLETNIREKESYIIIRLTRHNSQFTLYSIVDKIRNR